MSICSTAHGIGVRGLGGVLRAKAVSISLNFVLCGPEGPRPHGGRREWDSICLRWGVAFCGMRGFAAARRRRFAAFDSVRLDTTVCSFSSLRRSSSLICYQLSRLGSLIVS